MNFVVQKLLLNSKLLSKGLETLLKIIHNSKDRRCTKRLLREQSTQAKSIRREEKLNTNPTSNHLARVV